MMPKTNFKLLHDAKFNKTAYRKLAKKLGGIRHYGRISPIHLLQILDICGLYNAIWALRVCPHSEKFALVFAYDCAEHALRFGGENKEFDQVLKVAQHIVSDATKADEVYTAQTMLQKALQEVTTPSNALATSMLLCLISEPPAEAAYSVATRAAAYVDLRNSRFHYPSWLAIKYEIEWQEYHLRKMLSYD